MSFSPLFNTPALLKHHAVPTSTFLLSCDTRSVSRTISSSSRCIWSCLDFTALVRDLIGEWRGGKEESKDMWEEEHKGQREWWYMWMTWKMDAVLYCNQTTALTSIPWKLQLVMMNAWLFLKWYWDEWSYIVFTAETKKSASKDKQRNQTGNSTRTSHQQWKLKRSYRP